MLGWGVEVITISGYWSFVSIVACHLGGVAGVMLYRSIIWFSSRGERACQPSQTADSTTPKKVFIHTVTLNKDKISNEVRDQVLKVKTFMNENLILVQKDF